MEASRIEVTRSIGLLLLRSGIGGYMLTHGWGKLQMVIKGEFDSFADPFGIGMAASLILVTFAEFLCSILVMAGVLTRLAVIPIIITMAVAAFWAHGNDPWTMGEAARLYSEGAAPHWGSKQPPLMFLIVFLSLMFTGAGMFSVDGLIRRRRTARA